VAYAQTVDACPLLPWRLPKTKLLLERDDELQCRTKNAAEHHERVADESELAPLPLGQKCRSPRPSLPPVGIQHGPKRVFGITIASNNQAYHALGAHPIERHHLIVHSGDRLIEELLVVFDRCLPEPKDRILREAKSARRDTLGILQFRH
jgi:hypothetical protein